MGIMSELMDTISEVIDMKSAYRIIRRPYDEEFARAHSVTLLDITDKLYIPCIFCGTDIVGKILVGKVYTNQPVFCDLNCRSKHALVRLSKFTEETNIREAAKKLVAMCLTVDIIVKETDVKKRTTPLVVRKLLAEHNRLAELTLDVLKQILKEVTHANRDT